MTARMGREATWREISWTLWRRFSLWISTQGSKEESFETEDSGEGEVSARVGTALRMAGIARPASRKERREDFIEGYFLNKSSKAWRASFVRGGAEGAEPAGAGCA